jgi:hypothetical protein
MAWARLDDGFFCHPKVTELAELNPPAGFLHIRAISYCTKYLTDGFITRSAVASLVPVEADREEQVKALIDVGLWYLDPENDRRYAIHDFLDWNPSKVEVNEKRLKDRERKRSNAAQ